MIITINSQGKCFIGGEKGKGCNGPMTRHHTIPLGLRPVNNVIVDVCKRHHDQLNEGDLKSMYLYAYKIEKMAEETRNSANILSRKVNKYVENNKEKEIKK